MEFSSKYFYDLIYTNAIKKTEKNDLHLLSQNTKSFFWKKGKTKIN